MAQTQTRARPQQRPAQPPAAPANRGTPAPIEKPTEGGRDIAMLPLAQAFEAYRPRLVSALPPGLNADAFIGACITAVNMNLELASADRRTLFNACVKCAMDGLIPDGRDAALVVYRGTKIKNEFGQEQRIDAVQYMPMVSGIRKRLYNSGEVLSADAKVVHAKDRISIRLGVNPDVQHLLQPGQDRGEAIGAYSIIKMKNGEVLVDYMDRKEIEKSRSQSKTSDSFMWTKFWEQAACKTVMRRNAKAAPQAAVLQQLIRRDEEYPDPGTEREILALPMEDPLPRPRREDYIDERSASTEQPQPQEPQFSCVVVDLDAEERDYISPAAAIEGLEGILRELARRAGRAKDADERRRVRAAIDASAENNAGAILALARIEKHNDEAKALVSRWHEIVGELDPFGLPTEQQQQGPRNDAPDRSPPAADGQRGSIRGAPDFMQQWNAIKPPQDGDRRGYDEAMSKITDLLGIATVEDLAKPLLTSPLVKAMPDQYRARIADMLRRRNAQLKGEAGNG